MSRHVHHASNRTADIGSEFAHARYVAVPALLWAVAIVGAIGATALQDTPATAPAPVQTAPPAEVAVVPLGA